MNSTQWLFELEGLTRKDEMKYEDIEGLFKISRKVLIDLLGLNIIPIESERVDEQGVAVRDVRPPLDHEFTPLSVMTAREDILNRVKDLYDEMKAQEEALETAETEDEGLTLEDLEKKRDLLLGRHSENTSESVDDKEFDEEGDIVFPEEPMDFEKQLKWMSAKNAIKGMIKPLSEKDKELETVPERPKSKVRIISD